MSARFILWLRQLKRYFRSRARMIGSLGQPTLFLLALGFGLGPTFARAGRGDYVLAPGIVTMGILFTAVFSGIEIIWDRQFGFLKETLCRDRAKPPPEAVRKSGQLPPGLLYRRSRVSGNPGISVTCPLFMPGQALGPRLAGATIREGCQFDYGLACGGGAGWGLA